MAPNHLPKDEEAAALAVKFVKLLMQQTETDSDTDHWRVLKDKVAQLEPIADAILGQKTEMILDDLEYLVPDSDRLPLKEAVCQ
jgi:TRAP-type mannitol/chloroaromatic compound transport system substrate-binding protein